MASISLRSGMSGSSTRTDRRKHHVKAADVPLDEPVESTRCAVGILGI